MHQLITTAGRGGTRCARAPEGPARWRSRILLTFLFVLLAGVLTSPASLWAQSSTTQPDSRSLMPPEPTTFRGTRSRWNFGFQLGFGLEHSPPRNISHVKLLIAQPQLGLILWDSPNSRWPVRRLEFINEGIFGNAIHPGGRMTGYTMLLRFDGKATGHVVPFLDLGGGVMNTTLSRRIPELSGSTQFMPQGGLGVQYFLNPQRAVVVEYRFIHVSNAALERPNPGFNGSMVSIGFRWLRRPGCCTKAH